MAMTGILVQSFVRFPGFPPFDVSNAARPLAVFERLCSLETQSVVLALLCIGLFELTVGKQVRLPSCMPPLRGEDDMRVASRTDVWPRYCVYRSFWRLHLYGYSREAIASPGWPSMTRFVDYISIKPQWTRTKKKIARFCVEI